MTIHLLVSNECLMISGANANSNYEGIRPNRINSRGGAPDSCANNIVLVQSSDLFQVSLQALQE